MAEVVIEKLNKIFRGPGGENIHAVKDASLTVASGEFLVLVGPSGCGKSTTLRMIAGLEEITSGSIAINGQIVNNVPSKDRDIAMVFQNHALYPHMTVRENLSFGLKLRNYSKAEIEKRVKDASEILGLRECLERRPNALSGGQRQRVALGRAIVRQPKVFLFDEPLSNLDAQMRVQMRREIAALHTRLGATMIFVTHDQVEAMTLGDRIVVMQAGAIQQVAEPLELYRHPANLFVAGFIGSPPMNLFQGGLMMESGEMFFLEDVTQINESLKKTSASAFKVRVEPAKAMPLGNYVGKKITLGLRPEHITEQTSVSDAKGESSISAIAELIEPLGAETYLYAASGGHSIVARIPTGHKIVVNQPVTLALDMTHAHFFDGETTKALC